jgi:hypothetical protein
MADPFTPTALAITSIAATAIGTGVSVAGGMAQRDAIRKQAAYNAKLQKQQAALTREDSRENRARMREDKRRKLARLQAYYAGMGIESTSGTPLKLYGETASKLELAVADRATSDERRAQALESGAALTTWSGENRARAAGLSTVGSAISGVGSLASDSFQFYDEIFGEAKNQQPQF